MLPDAILNPIYRKCQQLVVEQELHFTVSEMKRADLHRSQQKLRQLAVRRTALRAIC